MSELETETQSAVTSGVTEDASSIRERSKIFFAGGLGAGIAIQRFATVHTNYYLSSPQRLAPPGR